MDTVLVNIL